MVQQQQQQKNVLRLFRASNKERSKSRDGRIIV